MAKTLLLSIWISRKNLTRFRMAVLLKWLLAVVSGQNTCMAEGLFIK